MKKKQIKLIKINKNNKIEFSKSLLIQESVLIWIMTVSLLILAYICVCTGFIGELPWLAVMVGLPWSAYGISQMYYYKKAEKENTKNGIKYESIMAEIAKYNNAKQGIIDEEEVLEEESDETSSEEIN